MCSGLGAGFRFGEICGAVSGAVLVVGMKYGQETAADKDTKNSCNARIVEFMSLFRARNNFVVCREILGLDLSIKEEYERARELNLFKTTCVDMVRSAVEILEELGY